MQEPPTYVSLCPTLQLDATTVVSELLTQRAYAAQQQLMRVQQQIATCQANCQEVTARNQRLQQVLDELASVRSLALFSKFS